MDTNVYLKFNNTPGHDDDNKDMECLTSQDMADNTNKNIKTGDGYYSSCIFLLIAIALLFWLSGYVLRKILG